MQDLKTEYEKALDDFPNMSTKFCWGRVLDGNPISMQDLQAYLDILPVLPDAKSYPWPAQCKGCGQSLYSTQVYFRYDLEENWKIKAVCPTCLGVLRWIKQLRTAKFFLYTSLGFGKHKGKTLGEILLLGPEGADYLKWLREVRDTRGSPKREKFLEGAIEKRWIWAVDLAQEMYLYAKTNSNEFQAALVEVEHEIATRR